MAACQASKVLQCIRTLALHQQDGVTDGNLLDLYVRQKDEAAFEALVRRHGRMVLGVCRRILGNSHDAEDAFQATFLVLVRKAGSIRPSGMVGNWLYGVAQRTALEARRAIAKRRAKEAQVAPRTETPDDTLAQLRPLLDQELPRLPDKYRVVLVLCDLEGRTRKEAAHQLGLPEGTVASRLGRARITLAKRLTRHGVTLSGGALATALAKEAASASAPPALVFATVRAATAYAVGPAAAAAVVSAPVVALTEGVMKIMLLSKLKNLVLLLVVIGVVGTGWGNYQTWANEQPAVQSGPRFAPADMKQPKTGQPERDQAKNADGNKPADDKKPANQDPATPALDMLLKGLQASQASKARDGERPNQETLDRSGEAFLKAFQISSEIAKAMANRTAKVSLEDQAVLDSCGPAFLQAYERAKILKKTLEEQQTSDGKRGEKALEALDVFLKVGTEFEQAVKQRAKTQAVQRARGEIENAVSKVAKSTHDRRTQLETLEEIERVVQQMKKKLQESRDGK